MGLTLIIVYIAVQIAVSVYGFHRYTLTYLYLTRRHYVRDPAARMDSLPKVTIQLPLYNEGSVAERLIRASCEIDYPPNLLEFQVLDDSTDESVNVVQRVCDEMADKGHALRFIHREDRHGYKAGALANGLKQASGELVAVFDADFLPPKDFLKNIVDYFADPCVGMVQIRWGHLNRDTSLLTKCQAIFLDGHFYIEHTARNRSGRFVNFNGTAGVLRRACIEDAGGWQHDTLTEDLDLSYRAQLKGWNFIYLPQFEARAELPSDMISFKQQAHRWTKGSIQTCLKILPTIFRSRQPLRVKVEAFFHLTNTVVYPLMALLTFLMFPCFLSFYGLSGRYASIWRDQYIFSIALFILGTCSACAYFVIGQKESRGSKGAWNAVFLLPILMAWGVGISLSNAIAVLEAVWGTIRGTSSEFVRTPKCGVIGNAKPTVSRETRGKPKEIILPLLEIICGFYMLFWIVVSVRYNACLMSLPFLIIFSAGYFYVGLSSMWIYQGIANNKGSMEDGVSHVDLASNPMM